MSDFRYEWGAECGMGGPVLGSIFCDEILISDCVDDPVFFPAQQIAVFQLYVTGWQIHSRLRPLMTFHRTTGEVWTIDPCSPYGRLRPGVSGFPQVTQQRVEGQYHYVVDQRRTPSGTMPFETMRCAACLELQRRCTGESCPDCRQRGCNFWNGLFPAEKAQR